MNAQGKRKSLTDDSLHLWTVLVSSLMVSCQRVICGVLYLKFQVLCRKSDVPADCEMRKGLLAITVIY